MSEDHSELDAMIACLGLEYSAYFVPQSQSRNASEKNPSLNWRVTIEYAGRALTTDYMQGIGHLPNAGAAARAMGGRNFAVYERGAAEEGKYGRYSASGFMINAKLIPAPLLRDVLYCLVLDASVIDCATFEEWASEYGYDTDSREAEKTYRSCLEIALQLRALIGTENLNKLREAFQNY